MQALILAGGSGTRFWPLSRRRWPKQLLALDGEKSLLQATVARLEPLIASDSIWICTTAELVEAVGEQLPDVPKRQILAEPVGRNTAPAIAWSVSSMPPALRAQGVAVLPADHYVSDSAAFRQTLQQAVRFSVDRSCIMTLGVKPTRAETGYGYLEVGDLFAGDSRVRRVVRFTEKPDLDVAERFVASGSYLWNAGIFVFPGDLLIAKMREHQPDIGAGIEALATAPEQLGEIWSRMPSISIDHGVMEKLSDLGTLPLDCGWSDLGSWEALWELSLIEGDDNVTRGSVIAEESRGNLLYAAEGTIAVLGVEGLVVVRTGDAVLVVSKERSQEVRRIVERLERAGKKDLL